MKLLNDKDGWFILLAWICILFVLLLFLSCTPMKHGGGGETREVEGHGKDWQRAMETNQPTPVLHIHLNAIPKSDGLTIWRFDYSLSPDSSFYPVGKYGIARNGRTWPPFVVTFVTPGLGTVIRWRTHPLDLPPVHIRKHMEAVKPNE